MTLKIEKIEQEGSMWVGGRGKEAQGNLPTTGLTPKWLQ